METTALGELLAAKLGLDAESMGRTFLSSIARRSLNQFGYSDLPAFVRAAAAGGEAWQRLVDLVVVSETWFFRDEAPFDYIAEAAWKIWQAHGNAPIRVLSCPCSTGEEAYSVAIALSASGLPSNAFTIDAADVNPSSLSTAETGIFKSRSFRGSTRVDRKRYFQHDAATQLWSIKPEFRSMVQFRPANLVSFLGLENSPPYDIVLCRNLLIYLHAQARANVMAALRRLIAENGILIVGHAEPAIAREHGFTGAGDPQAFAFARSPARQVRKQTPSASSAGHVRTNNLAPYPGTLASTGVGGSALTAASGQPRQVALTLEKIRQLGDEGRMDEAVHACRDYVRRVPDSADGYFLLGVFCNALKDDRAAEAALRRALYLEPNHAGALTHLALTHDAKGDTATAARLRARANRSAARETQR